MGRVVTVAMTCDRCGADCDGKEIDLLNKNSAELVDETKEGLSDVPAFEAKMGSESIRYDDLCGPCEKRLGGLFKDAGTVKRRGHTRTTTTQQELGTDGGNGKSEKKGEKDDKKTEAKPPKAPSKPSAPKNPPKPQGDNPVA